MRKLGLCLFTLFILNSCSELEYKYAYQPTVLKCDDYNVELISEAVYTFEDYLMKSHVFKEPKILQQGYANYWGIGTSHFIPRVDTFEPHVFEVFEALKSEEGLWREVNGVTRLDVNGPILRCIQENIKDSEFKATLKSLLDTQTYRSDIFIPVMTRKTDIVSRDKALSTLVALDMFYAKLFDIDLSRDPKEIMDEQREKHAGHNH